MTARRSPRAFTLLETIVAIGIFVLISGVVIDIFLTSGRTERQGVARQQVVSSARVALEIITRELRLGAPEHFHFGLVASPVLSVRRSDGLVSQYGFSPSLIPNQLAVCTGLPCLNADFRALTIARAQVVDFKVYTWPASDPFAPGATVNEQPRTTIALTVRSGRPGETVTTTVQTTVVSRRYVR